MTVFRLYFNDTAELDVRPEDVDSIDIHSGRMVVEAKGATYYAHRVEQTDRHPDSAVPLQS